LERGNSSTSKISVVLIDCTKFGLILRKITKIVATRCHILRLKCNKFDFGWGYAPDPAGSLQRSPDPLAALRGPTSKGGGGRKERKGRGTGRGGGAYTSLPQ